MSSDKHASLIKTPRQLITVVILAFLVPVVLIILLATFVASQNVGGAGSDAMTPEAIAERLRPVGAVAFAGAPTGPRTSQNGEAVYKLACSACHATGAAGAPKAGDNSAWAPRIKQGFDTLVKHAVEGYKGMPARGGNPDLDPIEVARAVAYIANQSGAKFKEPEAPAAVAAKSSARSGEQIVQATCGNCHNAGINGAPKIGDRAAWTKRVSNGVDAVTAAAIKGHGGMPARGGMADLTDAELKSAVQYMFSQSVGAAATAATATAATAPTTQAASRTARRSTRWRATPATRRASPVRRSMVTRSPGPRAARRESTPWSLRQSRARVRCRRREAWQRRPTRTSAQRSSTCWRPPSRHRAARKRARPFPFRSARSRTIRD